MLKIEPGREASEPRDAATVILLREVPGGREGGFEVFLVRRHQKSRFMGGAYVFPGGKLDAADCEDALFARISDLDMEGAALRLGEDDLRRSLGLHVAALRETLEEAGVILAEGIEGEEADERSEALRAALAEGRSLLAISTEEGLSLRAGALIPFARWITPEVEPRRYDARFFLALAPADQVARHDQTETTAGAWMRPGEALKREQAGEIQLPPPTLHTLDRLTAYASAEDALEGALALGPPPVVCPVFRDLDGVWALTLPGDPEHPVQEAAYPGTTRFVLSDGRWEPRAAR